jgi:hypothetical protein
MAGPMMAGGTGMMDGQSDSARMIPMRGEMTEAIGDRRGHELAVAGLSYARIVFGRLPLVSGLLNEDGRGFAREA